MGIFSSIVSFVKNVVKAIVNAIASIINGIFGSPLVAALAMFVIAFILTGPGAFALLLENPILFLAQYPILAAATCNLITAVATAIDPQFGRVVGYVMGIVSFVLIGMNTYTFLTEGTFTGAQLATCFLGSALNVSSQTLLATFTFLTAFSWMSFVTNLAAGENSPYVTGFVDGLFAVPEAAASVADAAVDGVLGAASGALSWLLIAAGVYVGYKVLSGDGRQRVDVQLQPARLQGVA